MRYKTKDIGEGGLDLRVAVTGAWLAAECPDGPLGVTKAGLCLEGRLEAAGDGYLLRGTLRGELLVSCARCLEVAPVAVEAPMAVTFIEVSGTHDADADATQDDVVTFEHGVIDLGGPIRDEILLAVPMSPVCRPDCAGICPVCGQNRNVTPCDCEPRTAETGKLGALAKIKLQ
jgi:uncharacterized protein